FLGNCEVDVLPLFVLRQLNDESVGTVVHPWIVQGPWRNLAGPPATADLPRRRTRRSNRYQVFPRRHTLRAEMAVFVGFLRVIPCPFCINDDDRHSDSG